MKIGFGGLRSSFAAVLLGCGMLAAAGAAHAQFNANVFAKWGSVEVLKYSMVATYKGTPQIVDGGVGIADVTDRYDLEFRWNQFDAKLVGEPTFRNYPADAKNVRGPSGCDAPEISGKIEYVTVKSVSPGPTTDFLIRMDRAMSAANAPVICTGRKAPVAAKTLQDTETVTVPGIALFGMPAGTSGSLVAKGDTLTIKDGEWTYVYTLSKG